MQYKKGASYLKVGIILVILIIFFSIFIYSGIHKRTDIIQNASSDWNIYSTLHPNEFLLKKLIITNESDYSIKKQEGFDLLRLKEGRWEGQPALLPYHEYEFDLPNDAEIISLNISFRNISFIGKLNIPEKMPCPNCIGCICEPYKPVEKNLGLLPSEPYSWRIIKKGDRNTLLLDIFPFRFDSSTQDTNLYKEIEVVALFNSYLKGYVDKFYNDKGRDATYNPGETITTRIKIKNTYPEKSKFTSNVWITDEFGKILINKSFSKIILPNTLDQIEINLTVPEIIQKIDAGRLNFEVFDEKNRIGESFIFLHLNPPRVIEIESYNVPEKVSINDFESSFNIGLRNPTNKTITVFIDTHIYKDYSTLIKDLLQSKIELKPLEETIFKDKWSPKLYSEAHLGLLIPGQYYVQSVVKVDGFEETKTEYFTIVE